MKILLRLFHFLSGIKCAICLIALTAVVVIAGTILESKTGSHRFAARSTYEHPLFTVLLALFFVNILFSAIRRWPFKIRHIPFLLTHLGLLMIIGGTIVKNRYGIQGHFTVWEGSGNQTAIIPNTSAIRLEKNEKDSPNDSSELIALHSTDPGIRRATGFPEIECNVIRSFPHVRERFETWIKGSKGSIKGLPPIDASLWRTGDPLPPGTVAEIPGGGPESRRIYALGTTEVDDALRKLYQKNLFVKLVDKQNPSEKVIVALEEALESGFHFGNFECRITLNLIFPPNEGISSLLLDLFPVDLQGENVEAYRNVSLKFTIPLEGVDALSVLPGDLRNEPFFTVDLVRDLPLLGMIKDSNEDIILSAFDLHGRVDLQRFSSERLTNLVSYDDGFGGYAVYASLSYFSEGREETEKMRRNTFTELLRSTLHSNPRLSAPLALFRHACAESKVDFPETLSEFISRWNDSGCLLFSDRSELSPRLESALRSIDWTRANPEDFKAIRWIDRLFKRSESDYFRMKDLQAVLIDRRWPLIEALKELSAKHPDVSDANLLAGQLFSTIHLFPDFSNPSDVRSPGENGRLLSAFFRAYEIDYRTFIPFRSTQEANSPFRANPRQILIETPVFFSIIPSDPPPKLEDRTPGIILEVSDGKNRSVVPLTYDREATGMARPVLGGSYLVRFQPETIRLPYRVRLRKARQISYPGSSRTYSYESDVLIARNDRKPVAETLSMNRVHETPDGYRFYLSGIGSSEDSGIKRILIVVNRDPVKYRLTYPGSFLVFVGILLLFWFRPRPQLLP